MELTGAWGREPEVWATAAFLVLFPVVQWAGFRMVGRRAAAQPEGAARAVPGWALPRIVLLACALFAAPAVGWALGAGAGSPGRMFAGVELILAFGLLAAGLSLASVRLALRLARAGVAGRRAMVRLGPWLFGTGYGVATALLATAGPGSTLFAVFLLGVAFAAWGLNRAGEVTMEGLRRLG